MPITTGPYRTLARSYERQDLKLSVGWIGQVIFLAEFIHRDDIVFQYILKRNPLGVLQEG